jgi:hypothetical protein
MEYSSYITSSKWERRKGRYYAKHPRVCRGCGAKTNIHLHHHTYKRLGHELDEDLVPLCESCHVLVHQYHQEKNGWSLTRATAEFLHLSGATLRPGCAKKKPRRRGKKTQTATEKKISAASSPFKVGDRVVFVGTSRSLSWALNKSGTIQEVLSESTWCVELDGMPGSRLSVTRGAITRIRGRDPVNTVLQQISQQRRSPTRKQL